METRDVRTISVNVKPPTKAGRLYPRYDEESGILAVESSVQRDWLFGIDIDGTLVFDLDEQRVLANFDLHIPKDRWERDLGPDATLISRPGDLMLTPESIAQKSFNLPIRVRTDSQAQRLRIEIGVAKADHAVALSESCVALLARNDLVGFVIRIVDSR
ncbi:MAG: hypothetical protein ACREV5_00750 [Steroidobacter sp.]